MIYFIASEDGNVVKIGHSTDVQKRLIRHSKQHCRRLILLATCEGTYADEQRVHAVLARHRIGGEWYWHCPTVQAFMAKAIADGVYAANEAFSRNRTDCCGLPKGRGGR